MAASPAAVVHQMMQAGMPPLAPHELRVGAQRIVRYGPKKRAWYTVHEIQARRSDGSPRSFFVGTYGLWGRIESTPITVDHNDADTATRERIRAQAAALHAREEARRRRDAERAARNAVEIWRESRPLARRVGYLARKKVDPLPPVPRVDHDDVIVVPMLRYDSPRESALVGVQQIWSDGRKHFPYGTAKAGAACRLGPPPVPGQALLMCEGLATGLSIAHALREPRPVFVCFDAGNLLEVAQVLRAVFPAIPIGVCADDDFETPGNPGVRYALKAARKVGNASMVRPLFGKRETKLTDFNDLHLAEGIGEVRAQLEPFVRFLEAP